MTCHLEKKKKKKDSEVYSKYNGRLHTSTMTVATRSVPEVPDQFDAGPCSHVFFFLQQLQNIQDGWFNKAQYLNTFGNYEACKTCAQVSR